MLHSLSYQFLHKVNILKQHLSSTSKNYDIKTIYITKKCNRVIHSFLQESQIYQCGYQKVISSQIISPYLNLSKIVVLMNICESDLKEVQQYNYLFPQIYLLTLTFTNESNYEKLKISPLRSQIKKIKQIPLNFIAHLDYLYFLNEKNNNQKIVSFCSYLLSLQKLAEFQLFYPKKNSQIVLNQVNLIKQELKKGIQLMQRHNYKSYDQKSSPRTKILILNRQILQDYVSPLLYTYYYGSWMEQIFDTANSNNFQFNLKQYLNPQARIQNKIWQMDILKASQYLEKIVGEKIQINDPFEANYCYKVKKVMSQSNKPDPLQVTAHIQIYNQIRKKAQKKQQVAQLQQDLVNSLNFFSQKLSNGDCVNQVNKWLLNGKNVSQQEYLKMVIIVYCTHNLWFFQKNSLKNPIQKDFKILFKKFQQHFKTNKGKSLNQKSHFADRFTLFRHFPNIIQVCIDWIQAASKKFEQTSQFNKIDINSSLKNRQNKFVIYMSDQLGYNQAVLLRKNLKQKTNKEVTIICNRLVNTSSYLKILCQEDTFKL